MFKIFSATATVALFFTTRAVYALPQASQSDASSTTPSSSDSWSSIPSYTSSYSSTASPYSSPYSSTTDYYPTTTSSYSMGTPYYSSQPSYTSSSYCPPPKETYPPTVSASSPTAPQPNTPTPSPLRATYDPTYDNSAGSMNTVACSDGSNGLAARFPTFGNVPSFPFIGGAFDVVWNSPNCGGCWNITNPTTGVSIHMTAIDTATGGFNIAQQAFEKLNGGQIGQGVLDVVANKVAASVCGL